MRTNIVLNDELVNTAFQLSPEIQTKKELIEVALKEYIQQKSMSDFLNLKGKIEFDEDYTYISKVEPRLKFLETI